MNYTKIKVPGKLYVIPCKFLCRIQRSIERCSTAGKNLVTKSLIVQLLHTVQSQRLIVQVELVGKQLRTRTHQLQVANGKDANHAHTFTVAWPVERTIAPVLEARDETIFVVIRLWLTCIVKTLCLVSINYQRHRGYKK